MSVVAFSFLCQLFDKYGTCIARCNALIEKVTPCRDNSGSLSFEEFRRAVRKDAKMTTQAITDAELKELFQHIDESGDGDLSLEEFTEFLESGPPSGAAVRHASVCGQALHKIILHAQ
eukprot:SAG31_NODE_23675_length_498_cov_46.689223_2_plen_117_part_01